MTTLPQTTSIRLPRSNGAMQLSPSGGGVPVLAGNAASANGMSGNDIWRVIRANIWMILGMLLLFSVAGYAVNYFLGIKYPRFTATGYVLVTANPPSAMDHKIGSTEDTGALAVEQKTQAAMLKTETLLAKVLSNDSSELRQTQWFKRFKGDINAAKEDFVDRYTVTPLPETRLVRVEFTDAIPKDCATIVREMVNQHIKDEMERVFIEGRSLSQELNALKTKYIGTKSENDAKLAGLRSKVQNGGGGVMTSVNLKEIELEHIRTDQTKMELDYKGAVQQLEQIQASLQQGITPFIIQNIVDQNPQLAQLKAQADQAEATRDAIIDASGKNNPKVELAGKQADRYRAKAKDLEAELLQKASSSVLEQLSNAVVQGKKNLDQGTARMEELTTSLGETMNDMARYFMYEAEQKGTLDQLKQVQQRLDQLETETADKIAGKVKWSQMPEIPANKSFPQLKIVMPLSIAIGLLLALSIAFLREMTDTTVRTQRDIERVGQMTLLGMVGDENDDPQAAGSRLPLVIFDAPHSMTAEQLRQVRTRLQHAASLDTTRSLLVTSPSPGDGKTTIACNLAAGLALNGRRILLVDGNFRRPEIHKVFALSNEQGFSDVLNGAVTFDEVVQESPVPNLAIMTSGPKPINATEMFESQLLIDFIERALEEFDHVIFDSGPMMVVSESAAMAPRVDGVISVVRARGNSRGLLQRMRDSLRAVKAEHLGVVLNGVRATGGGYYGRNIKTYYEYQS